MPRISRRAGLGVGVVGIGAAALSAVALASSPALSLTDVPSAQDKAPGIVRPNVLSPELFERAVAQGADRLDGGTDRVPYYGYDSGGPMVPPSGSAIEAQKTEPDKNTYLVMDGLEGPDAGYDYGRHFLYQGHEAGKPGYLTRVNLDADGAHRVSLLATQDVTGNDLPDWDGSTWDPWAKRLLLTSEAGPAGGVWQATPDYPSRVRDISSVLGRGGYEGIQNDDRGNVYIVEDVGGKTGSAAAGLSHAKQPNSFVYRFLPNDPAALRRGGTLQALQVIDASGQPIMFGGTSAEAIDADLTSPQNRALRSYGHRFATRWVDLTLNDAYDANAAAKAAGATPFKRPENGQFRPGSGFSEFYFDETGDTTLLTPEEAAKDPGGYGSVFRLDQSPESNEGSISLVYAGDAEHAAFDNLAFASRDLLAVVEDAGDALHTARNALDSGYLLDVTEDYGAPGAAKPVRWLAEGRDPSATIDSGLSGQPGFTNEGDNEITGIHISNGNPHKQGILGAQIPTPFRHRWRVFWTQQHGDNITWELMQATRTGASRIDTTEG